MGWITSVCAESRAYISYINEIRFHTMKYLRDSDAILTADAKLEEEKSGALVGIRVLDLSRVLAGPWAGQILGDLGAEVIKVENPKGGDDTRVWGPPFIEDGEGTGRIFTGYYLACNRNKRSIAIDMAKPEGAALVRRLAAESDVVIENFKVGGLAKYGLD